jgi:hypothetical protein
MESIITIRFAEEVKNDIVSLITPMEFRILSTVEVNEIEKFEAHDCNKRNKLHF